MKKAQLLLLAALTMQTVGAQSYLSPENELIIRAITGVTESLPGQDFAILFSTIVQGRDVFDGVLTDPFLEPQLIGIFQIDRHFGALFDPVIVGLDAMNDVRDSIAAPVQSLVILQDKIPNEKTMRRFAQWAEDGGGLIVMKGLVAAWTDFAGELL